MPGTRTMRFRSEMADQWFSRRPATPIQFTANNPETTVINQTWPIEELRCRLVGTYTVSGSSSTLNPNGFHALNLMRKVKVWVDGRFTTYNLPGILTQHVGDLYQAGENAKASIAPGTSVGSHDFECVFNVPINGGPGPASLLDATWRNQVTMEVDWGNVDSIATAGGSHELSNVRIEVDTMQRAGGQRGAFGGPDFGRVPDPTRSADNGDRPAGRGYPIHILSAREVPVNAAQDDLQEELIRGHAYSRVAALSLNDGAPSNAIINRMGVVTDQTTRQRPDATQIQAEMVQRYGWSDRRAGWYVLDLANAAGPRQPRIPEYLSMRSAAIPFYVELGVNNPSGDNMLWLLLDRYQPPDVG